MFNLESSQSDRINFAENMKNWLHQCEFSDVESAMQYVEIEDGYVDDIEEALAIARVVATKILKERTVDADLM